MKKNIILLGFLSALLFLGCDNFLNGSALKKEIDSAIDYANTPDVRVKIISNNAHGTLTAETGGVYKLGTVNNLGFEENEEWQFVQWKVFDSSNNESGLSEKDVIYISDPFSTATTFKVIQNLNGYSIQAVCAQRPAVALASPQFQTNGVNRDRSLVITFNTNIQKSNFRYSEAEALALENSGFTLLKDKEDLAYGYIKNGVVFFKNIKIRNANDASENLLSFFEEPEINGEKLSISPKKGAENQFELDANGIKDLEVTINSSVNNDGIKMRSNYTWTYRVSSATDSQTSINFKSDSVNGTLQPSENFKYSVGEEIKVSFTESELCKFIAFNIEDSDSEIPAATVTSVYYDEAKGVSQAIITVLEGNRNISITPECAPRPLVKNFSPTYTVMGSDFDSNIVIEFGAPVAEECFIYSPEEVAGYASTAAIIRQNPLSEESPIVAIDAAGERYFKNITIVDSKNHSISNHYKNLEFSNNNQTLTIYFDNLKLFDFEEESTKDIFVTIDSSVYSLYQKNDSTEEKVFLNKNLKPAELNFRLRKTSDAKAEITFDVMDNKTSMGILNYSGQKSFYLGENFTVIFEPNEAYGFIKWIVSGNEEGNLIVSENGTELNCKVAGGCEGITISPYCEKLNLSTILFESNTGSVSPSGYVEYRRKAKIPLVSTTSSNFCFTKWKVKNTLTKEIYDDEKASQYFRFENPNDPITTVTVLQDSANLSIIATAEARPRVFLTTPNGLSTQVPRDSNIRIFINKGISEKSLYYTKEEVNEFELKGLTILYGDEENYLKPYGYYLNENDLSSYVFKNIKISDNSDETNYLKYYGCPYLADSIGKTLVIPVKKVMGIGSTPDSEKNLPGNREILVEMGTEFGFYSDNVLVNLDDVNLTWAYKTHGNFDTTFPELNSGITTLKGTNTSGAVTYTTGGSIPSSLISDKDWYKNCLVKKNNNNEVIVNLNLTVTDTGSNLQTVNLVAKKVVNSSYNEVNDENLLKYSLPVAISGQTGTFNADINLVDRNTLGLTDGLYKVYFELIDEVGNITITESSHFYYLLIDVTAPQDNQKLRFFYKNGKVIVKNLRDNFNREVDYDSHTVTLNGAKKSFTNSDTYSNLVNGQETPFIITTRDIFGNERSYNYTYEMNAGVKEGMYMYTDLSFSETLYTDLTSYGVVISSDYTDIKVVTKPVYIASDCSSYYWWSISNVLSKYSDSSTTLDGKVTLDLPTIDDLYQIYEYRYELKSCGGADFTKNSSESFIHEWNRENREFNVKDFLWEYNSYITSGQSKSYSGTFYFSKEKGCPPGDTRETSAYIMFNAQTGSHIFLRTRDFKNLFYTTSGCSNNGNYIYNVKLVASLKDN